MVVHSGQEKISAAYNKHIVFVASRAWRECSVCLRKRGELALALADLTIQITAQTLLDTAAVVFAVWLLFLCLKPTSILIAAMQFSTPAVVIVLLVAILCLIAIGSKISVVNLLEAALFLQSGILITTVFTWVMTVFTTGRLSTFGKIFRLLVPLSLLAFGMSKLLQS